MSSEFPSEMPEKCDHIVNVCLQCVTEALKVRMVCPHCTQVVTDKERLRFIKEYRCFLAEGPEEGREESGPGLANVTIGLFDGSSFDIKTVPNETVLGLKQKIFREMSYDLRKQELVFKGIDLEDSNQLDHYKIRTGSLIQLSIVMLRVKSTQNLSFLSEWSWEDDGKDFLDGSCLVYDESHKVKCILDWKTHTHTDAPGVEHQGDKNMNEKEKKGYSQIDVILSRLPSNIHYLYFLLSTYVSDDISKFKHPAVVLQEKLDTSAGHSTVLCREDFSQVQKAKEKKDEKIKGVITCSLQRGASGVWRVFRLG